MSPRYIDQNTLLAREKEMLDRALEIISKQGVAALTMDKLVASVNYSKGTVYNHFSSKEDVFAALCNRNMTNVLSLFSRAAAIEWSSRDRMMAVSFAYMLSVLLSPQHFTLVMNAKTEMFEKASDARREKHWQLDSQLMEVISGIIQDAIDAEELILPDGVNAQQISFSCWAMSFGTIALLFNGEKVCSATTGLMLENRVIAHENIVMDGLGWRRPKKMNSEKNFIQYLKLEVFAEEISILASQGIQLLDS